MKAIRPGPEVIGRASIRQWAALVMLLAGAAPAAAQAPAVVQMPFSSLIAGGGTVCNGMLDAYGDGCPAAQSTFNLPEATAVDAQGNIYVADYTDTSLRVIYKGGAALANAIEVANANVPGLVPTPGNIYRLAGGRSAVLTSTKGIYYCNNAGTGAEALDNIGDGCPGYEVFIKPRGVAVDADGNVFVTNYANTGSVRVFYVGGTAAANLITAEEGVTPQAGYIYGVTHGTNGFYNGDGALAIKAEFVALQGLAVDQYENIYIPDATANVVRLIDGNPADTLHTYGYIYTIAGSAGCTESATTTSCPIGYSGDGAAATSASLGSPYSVFLDSNNNLYIVVYDSVSITGGLRVVYKAGKVPGISNPQPGYIYTVIGGGSSITSGTPATSINLGQTEAGGIDNNGNLYIDDLTNHALWQINSTTDIGIILAGTAATPVSGAYCNGTNGPVFTDAHGDGCPGIESPIAPNLTVAFDAANNLYEVESANNVLREFSWNTQLPATAIGSITQQPLAFEALSASTFASESFTLQGAATGEYSDAGASADTCTLATPEVAGTMCVFYVNFTPAQAGQREGSLTFSNGATTLASAYLGGVGLAANLSIDPGSESTLGSGFEPSGVSTDAAGNLYVADTAKEQLVKLPASGGAATTLLTGLSQPGQTAVDGFGNVYVADAGNNRVAEWSVAGTVASLGTGLSAPKGVATDALGDLYIADTGNHRVIKLLPGGGQTTLGFTGLSSPTQLAVDSAGDVFVADTGTKQVLELPAISPAQASINFGTMSIVPVAVAVDAAGDLYVADTSSLSVLELPAGSSSSNTLATGLTTPLGMAVDPNGSVYVADSAQPGVLDFNRNAAAIGFPFTAVGESSSSLSSILLSNTGNENLIFGTKQLSSATGNTSVFSITPAANNGCSLGETLDPSADCALTGTFTPVASATDTETATFYTNADNSGAVAVLTGTGAVLVTTSTKIAATAPANGSPVYGQTVTVQVTVTPSSVASSESIPTGTITVLVDGITQPAQPYGTGVITLSLNPGAGIHTISATYSGDHAYDFSSNSLTVAVSQASTATALNVSTSTPNTIATLNLTATVSSTQATGETGDVSFYAGSQLIATVPVNGQGVASYSTTVVTYPSYNFSAVYSGDTNFQGSTSAIFAETGDFALSSGSSSVAIGQGGVIDELITLTPLYNFSGTVTVSCSGLPANSLCRFQPTSLAVSGTAPITETVQIFTDISSTVAHNEPGPLHRQQSSLWEIVTAALFLPSTLLLSFWRRRSKLLMSLLLVFCGTGFLTLGGCSGTSTAAQPITPAGTQNVTVTFSGPNVSRAFTFSLTVSGNL